MLQTELIGRDREVAVLADGLAAAVRGDPAIVVIAGEAGIGKTRPAEELVHLARLGEVLAVWGRATDAAHKLGEGIIVYAQLWCSFMPMASKPTASAYSSSFRYLL